MLITFPHMGTFNIVAKALFGGVGLQVLEPPPMTRKTLELGVKYSPETACLPFKITLGSFLQSLSLGADTIITCGGEGPCRLGYYAQVQKDILTELGYDFQLIAIEPKLREIWQVAKRLAGAGGWYKLYASLKTAGAKLTVVDELERRSWYYRPRAKEWGQVDNVRTEALAAIDAANDCSAIYEVMQRFQAKLENLPCRCDTSPLRIGLVGEIYCMLDSFSNHDIIKRLGQLGVEVYGTTLLSDYVRTHLSKKRGALKAYQKVVDLASPYLGHYIGGHGIKSIGYTVQLSQLGFDGIIQVFPFTCMPEVIAKNILSEVSSENHIPVLSLAFDEHTGTEGMVTRLEAFVDLLSYRKKKMK
ncbi:MAG: Protein of unknown function CoA enzyme activase [Firmicutes bacterium]|nr:Protein of unknown function CoA enzyme activase [Bacillota bacterium]